MKILIATDGSEFSRAAVEASCRMFINLNNASIKVISVFEPPYLPAPEPYAVSTEYLDNFERQAKEHAEEVADQAVAEIREHFPQANGNLTRQISRGAPDQVVVEEAREWDADLIVVGSHGYGFWERMFLGSVSNSVVQHAPCSVLIVRNNHTAMRVLRGRVSMDEAASKN